MSKDKTIDHGARGHAPFGGSVASRRINCTGAFFLEQQVPVPPPTEDATQGTKAHECAEWAINDYLSMRVHGKGTDMKRPDFYPDYAEYASQYVQAIWKKVLFETITGKVFKTEMVLTIDKNLGMEGPADFVCLYTDERGRNIGVIVDFKFGNNWVDAKKNDQLHHYANGLLAYVRSVGKELHAVRAAIFQPRAGGESYREEVISVKALDKWRDRYFKAARTTLIEKKAKFKVGDWCKWCRAKSICKAYTTKIKEETKLELVNYREVYLPDVEKLPLDVLRKTVLNAKKIEDFLDAAKAHAKHLCLIGKEDIGLKVVEGAGKSAWIKDKEVVAATLKSKGINPYKDTIKSISEVKQAFKEKGLAADEVQEQLLDIVVRPSTQILVSKDDPRPAVTSDVEMLQEVLED